jgi:uncharacterized cupredoxin-like copper-binding protein
MFKCATIARQFPVRLLMPIAALVIGVGMSGPSQAAGTVVTVSLWDKGANMEMATDLGFPATGKDMSKVTMGVALSTETVKAGEVTFEVLNSSKDTVHEVIIARLKDVTTPLAYLASDSKVDEEKGEDHLGEVSELDPGKTGALRLELKPGHYLLFCNIPGHYMAGMWTLLTVK